MMILKFPTDMHKKKKHSQNFAYLTLYSVSNYIRDRTIHSCKSSTHRSASLLAHPVEILLLQKVCPRVLLPLTGNIKPHKVEITFTQTYKKNE